MRLFVARKRSHWQPSVFAIPAISNQRRFFVCDELQGYAATLNNLKIGQHTRVIFQGFTGKQATVNARESLAWGTNIVGGVTPGRTGEHLGLPVLPTVRQAAEQLRPHATGIYVGANQAASAIQEAIEAEIPLIVAVAEHIPLHDTLRIHSMLRTQSKSRLVGANTPGIISAVGRCRIGFQPLPFFRPGRVGIVAKSGTLSYEAVASTTRAGFGQSLCIGVGGDMMAGTDMCEALSVLDEDEDTDAIILIGEIGGTSELEVATWIRERQSGRSNTKPIAALIAGECALPGRVMGHAGAFSLPREASVVAKRRALADAGVIMVDHPQDFGQALLARQKDRKISQSEGQGLRNQRRAHHTMTTSRLPGPSRRRFIGMQHRQPRRSYYISSADALRLLNRKGVMIAQTPDPIPAHGRYVAIGIDRSHRCPCVTISPSYADGAAHPRAKQFLLPHGDNISGLNPDFIAKLLEFGENSASQLRMLLNTLNSIFSEHEAFSLEASVVEGEQGEIQVTCARFGFDDAAFRSSRRQADIYALRDLIALDSQEIEAEKHGITYVRLPGTGQIGTLVNGAGLAMNTVDVLEREGGAVANFLDTGGKATSETVRQSFEIILADERVRVVFVNIFGGLTLGDMIARGVVMAFRELALRVPVVVRIRGTNEKEGQKIIAESGLPLFAFDDFHAAARKAIALSREQSAEFNTTPSLL